MNAKCDQGDFYEAALVKLLAEGILDRQMKILVVCGGSLDKEVFLALGFSNVTISNLDVRMKGNEFAPFAWSYQDAEHLDLADESYDFCIAHNGLHHCYSPHRALLEMYRISKKGLLVLEPRDTWITRVGVRLNFGQEYEVAAVASNDCRFGGVRNTAVPNYVYRWTEREIEKTIRSFCPWGNPGFRYLYALRVPWGRLQMMRNRLFLRLIKLGLPIMRLFFALFPKQSNGFAFAVTKPRIPDDVFPWLKIENNQPVLNREWIQQNYREKKS